MKSSVDMETSSASNIDLDPCKDDKMSIVALTHGGRSMTDCDTYAEVFRNHWAQTLVIMERSDNPLSVDDVDPVLHYMDLMLELLIDEPRSENKGDGVGTILRFTLNESVFARLLAWSLRANGQLLEKLILEQLRLYELVINQSVQALLHQTAVLRPLLQLLLISASRSSLPIERQLVIVLHQLCVCIKNDRILLQYCLEIGRELSGANASFLVFSLLIPFIHREEDVGANARGALLLIMIQSEENNQLGHYIAFNSDFCPVLATGLSGLYSSLPCKLNFRSDDFHQLVKSDYCDMPDVVQFLSSLAFCDNTLKTCHYLIRDQLLKYIYDGFLVPVMGPALHQNSLEEVIAATAYLELFMRNVRESSLLRLFIKFLITESYDDFNILDSLVARINSNSGLGIVTMSLFNTLFDLHCEDVMYHLILRYLIPCKHLMLSQRYCLKEGEEVSALSKSAGKFLSLVPACCLPDSANSLSMGSKTSTPERVGSPNTGRKSTTTTTAAGNLANDSSSTALRATALKLEQYETTNYGDYLSHAKQRIHERAHASRSWVFDYDGENPSPDIFERVVAAEKDDFSAPSSEVQSTFCRALFKPDVAAAAKEEFCKPLSSLIAEDIRDGAAAPDHASDASLSTMLTKPKSSDAERVSQLYTLNFFETDSTILNEMECDEECMEVAKEDVGEIENVLAAACSSSTTLDTFLQCLDKVELDSRSSDAVVREAATVDEALEQFLAMLDHFESTSVANKRDSTTSIIFSKGLDNEQQQHQRQPHWEVDAATVLNGVQRLPRPVLFAFPFGCHTSTSTLTTNQMQIGGQLGPFMQALLSRLEGMPGNSLYTNLVLTGLLSNLAAYPQPLLRSLLLNAGLVLQPHVKSLAQVLSVVKHKIDCFSYKVASFETLLSYARRFLHWRGTQVDECLAKGAAASATHVAASTIAARERRRGSLLGELFGRHRKSSSISSFASSSTTSSFVECSTAPELMGYKFMSRRAATHAAAAAATASSNGGRAHRDDELESVRALNVVYAALVLEEFLKELSALCHEHSVLPVVY